MVCAFLIGYLEMKFISLELYMETEIYYFSTTGNSLAVAKIIGKTINAANIISIPSVMRNTSIQSDADTIGIVFPVYHATFGEKGIPNIVTAFINKLENMNEKYIFAVCTHNGYPGSTIEHVNNLLVERGSKLSAGAAIKFGLPYSTIQKMAYLLFHKPLSVNLVKEHMKRDNLEHRAEHKLNSLSLAINQKQILTLRKTPKLLKPLKNAFLALQRIMAITRYQQLSGLKTKDFQHLIRHSDHSFEVSDRCNGCGICQNVCPVNNIVLLNRSPKWLGACENCYACYQWCPQEAIEGKIVEFEKRYHHPNITLEDMLS
jgi:Pyruvate/2-oxoacid:ferredoxin oxidoreductase delta subunit/flavodoxin